MWRIKRSSLAKLGLVALSTGLTLLAMEVALRLFHPTPFYGYPYVPPQQQLFQYDPVLGWEGRPDARNIFAGPDFRVLVTHDGRGYRNTTAPKVQGKKNMLVVGDSYGWGWGVEDEAVFSAYITRNSDFNVYNLSAPGYGTDQQYLTLKRFLEDDGASGYSGAILLFYFNDFLDVLDTVRYSYPKPRFTLRGNRLVLENVPVPDLKKEEYDRARKDHAEPAGGFLEHSHAYNLIGQRSSSLWLETKRTIKRWIDPEGSRPPAKPSAPETDQALTMSLLQAIRALCKEHGMSFHVVLLVTSNTDEAWRRELERLAADMNAAGIEHSRFHGRRFPSTELWRDKHLSAYGHRLLASHVIEVLSGTR